MAPSDKQRKAIEFVAANPSATPQQIAEIAGVSVWGSNGPEFIWRLLVNGSLRLDVSTEVRDAMDEGTW